MNQKVKTAIIIVASLGAAYGVYRIIKHFVDKSKEEKDGESKDTGTKSEEQVAQAPATPNKPAFDENKVVRRGSKGSEVGAIQIAFNNIMNDMKKVTTRNYLKEGDDVYALEARKNQIANLKKLDANQSFRQGTSDVAKVILNKDAFSYKQVKQKRIDLAARYGLKNPYTKK